MSDVPGPVIPTKHPKYRTVRIMRGRVVGAQGIDPNLEGFFAEAKRRGVKVQGYTVDEDADEYKIRVLLPKDEQAEAEHGPRVFVP